jgi:hypothetical protein
MKATRAIGAMLIAVVLGVLVATPVLARDRERNGEREYSRNEERGDGHRNGNGPGHKKKTYNKIPELDPGVAGSAAVLLIGGTLALSGRRRLEPEA